MLTELEKAAKNGCKIVSINPLLGDRHAPLQESAVADRHAWPRQRPSPACILPVRINGDVAVLKGIMKEMLEHRRTSRAVKCSTMLSLREKTFGF